MIWMSDRSDLKQIVCELLPEEAYDQPVCQLSGGMKQRVCIIRALIAQSDTVNGISLGLFDGADTLNGLQLAPIAIALDARGVQLGLFNWCDDLHGVQIGFVNNGTYLGSHSHVHGVQIGFLNVVQSLCGVQIGFANVTQSLYGVQIGVANVVNESDYPCLPLLRASF